MKGDFSKGHRPDARRPYRPNDIVVQPEDTPPARFRRVLLQQGRVLLDSDLNALVDAQDVLHRGTLSDLGCDAGSPDRGFLVTPGHLLRLFDEVEDIDPGALEVVRDVALRYLERYPSVRLRNLTGAPATATIPLREPVRGTGVAVWIRGQAANVQFGNTGGPATGPGTDFTRVVVPAEGGTTEAQVTLQAGEEVHLGLLEETQNAFTRPNFWIADGSFHLKGWRLLQDASTIWHRASTDDASLDPTSSAPEFLPEHLPPSPAPPVGGRLVAYLEAWERHVSAEEDPAIREVALGSSLDTCSRTRMVAQVKTVEVPAGTSAEEVKAAFEGVVRSQARLDVIQAQGSGNSTDPCSLDTQGGYTGPDNRLFRFEIHSVDTVANTAIVKWSRDNGSRFYRARTWTANTLSFDAGHHPDSGCRVELESEVTVLGDADAAKLDPLAGTFELSQRRVGDLRDVTVVGGEAQFAQAIAPADYGSPSASMRAREWDGDVEVSLGGPAVAIADGIDVQLTGVPQVGEYWTYTARVGIDGDPRWANGARLADGPERQVTPLGLFEVTSPAATVEPLTLVAWLDERFAPQCEIDADDIPFDGAKVGETATTVQEILEVLLEREEACCCEVSVTPDGGDFTAQVQPLVDALPGKVIVCLQPGLYSVQTPFVVTNRSVVIKGCPDALLVDDVPNGSPFEVGNAGRLRFQSVTVLAPRGVAGTSIVQVAISALGFEAEAAGLLSDRPGLAAVRVGTPTPEVPVLPAWETSGTRIFSGGGLQNGPSLSFEDCVVAATWGIAGTRIDDLADRGSTFLVETGGIHVEHIGTVQLDGTILRVQYDLTGASTVLVANDLLDDPDLVMEQLLGATGVSRGAAVAAGVVDGGRITGGLLQGTFGVYVEEARELTVARNEIDASYGVHWRVAEQSRVVENQVDGTVGVHVAEFGEHIEIERLDFRGSEGVLLGRDIGPRTVLRTMRQVNVTGCRMVPAALGVALGEDLGTLDGEFLQVRISDNVIEGTVTTTGVFVRIPFPAANNSVSRATNGVAVSNNEIEANRGVLAEGAGISIWDNHLYLFGSDAVAVRGQDAPALNVYDNVASMDQPGATVYGADLDDCDAATLRGNEFRADATFVALRSRSSTDLVVSDNRFGGSGDVTSAAGIEFRGNHCADAFLISDKAFQTVTTVNDNVLMGSSTALTVEVANQGETMVQDNRAVGQIVVVPELELQITSPGNTGTIGVIVDGWLDDDIVVGPNDPIGPFPVPVDPIDPFPIDPIDPVDPIGPVRPDGPDDIFIPNLPSDGIVVGGNPASGDFAFPTSGGLRVPSSTSTPGLREAARFETMRAAVGGGGADAVSTTGEVQALAVSSPQTDGRSLAILDDDFAVLAEEAIANDLSGVFDDIVIVDDDPTSLGGPERQFRALVSGNLCEALQVGYHDPGILPSTSFFGVFSHAPHPDTFVTVTSNQARDWIHVGNYDNAVVALNLSRTAFGVNGVVGAFNNNNVFIP